MLTPLEHVLERVQRAKDDSDVAYFYELLNAGELVVKLAAAGLVACVEEDRERHRYRLEYGLVRADGVGDWASVIDDVLTGPASQFLTEDARLEQRELTQNYLLTGLDWQAQAVRLLNDARRAIDDDLEQLPKRVAARRWFSDFAALRNRTRGHGATRAAACSVAGPRLEQSIRQVTDHFSLLRRPWAHMRRNLSGKYRVTPLGTEAAEFDRYKSSSRHVVAGDGIYVHVGGPRRVNLLRADDDVRDFFVPNGGFNGRRYEMLSYASDVRLSNDVSDYLDPPTPLPPSDTEGLGELILVENAFTNLPTPTSGYVARPELESDLFEVLSNDRHPVVTMVGRGGIGKTSLALTVLHALAKADRFFGIVWFSARDIELLPEGPKLVRPRVLSPDDMAAEYINLVQPDQRGLSSAKKLEEFARALSQRSEDPWLFVFDNFETVRSPLDMYRWLDTHIRLPNKILITTRSREFRGDYWVEVGGMTEDQFSELIHQTAHAFGISHLIDRQYEAELYRETDGHPYLGKVMLGEIARSNTKRRVARLMASQDRMLEALFERTFSQLSPAARRLFLTLSSWRSVVPLVAISAAITRPDNERIDVDASLDELRRSSLVEFTTSPTKDTFVAVPLSATIFGRRKLATSPMKSAVDADTEFLRLFGPTQASGASQGVVAQLPRLFANVAEKVQRHPGDLERYVPVLEYVAREHPIGWVLLAQLYDEQRPTRHWQARAADAYRAYLDVVPDDAQIWRKLAQMCTLQGDYMGEIHALIQRAQLPGASYGDISWAALRTNTYLQRDLLSLDTDEKRVLVGSLVEVMEARIAEANATDHSRLAWLLLNVGDSTKARDVANRGLELDPTNYHCRNLVDRLSRQRA